ncbi:MAG: hypothetical protein ACRC2T_15400 [Thermoguttaceae bacterium]
MPNVNSLLPLCSFLLIAFVQLGVLFDVSNAAESPQSGESKVQFRIENELQSDKIINPIKTTTIFYEGVVYDIIGDNGEVTIFDAKNNSFTILDPARLVQSNISASDVKDFCDKSREKLLAHKNQFFSFLSAPKFQVNYEEETGYVTFQSKWIDYVIETKPLTEAGIAKEYFEFCDWYCYFNIRSNPSSLPLFARLKVNEFLKEKGRFPEKIQVKIYRQGNSGISGIVGKPDVSESSHKFANRLVPTDEQRIKKIIEQTKTFRSVPFADYLKE